MLMLCRQAPRFPQPEVSSQLSPGRIARLQSPLLVVRVLKSAEIAGYPAEAHDSSFSLAEGRCMTSRC